MVYRLPFDFERLDISDVILIKPKIFNDSRGYFMETFVKKTFENFGIDFNVVQENQSYSRKGVLRGLHYQLGKYVQAKIVRVLKGEIFDVAVDLRQSSPTFGKSIKVNLSEGNKNMLYIPRGFAHGFEVLSEDAIVVYLIDNDYEPKMEAGIRWNDPDLNINWPIKSPILSEKDSKWPTIKEAKANNLLI